MTRQCSTRETRTQLEMEYPDRRGVELSDLKHLRLDDPQCRLILLVLDLYINRQTGFWDLTHQELMAACELSRTVYYDRIRKLKELCLISVDDLPASNKKRFRIIRSNVADLARHHRRASGTKARLDRADSTILARHHRRASGTKARLDREDSTILARHHRRASGTKARLTDERTAVPNTDDPVPNTDRPVPNTDRPVPNTDRPVPNTDGTILLRSTEKDCPTTATTVLAGKGAATAAEVIRQMILAGVAHPTSAVDRALQRGSAPEELLGIVHRFRTLSRQHGFQPGALQRRVANHSPGLPLDVGWPLPGKTQPTSQPDLESTWGPQLDRMSSQQIGELIDRCGTETLRRLVQIGSVEAVATSRQWRPHLLRLLRDDQERS